ncbi:CsbD family protein, partial [Salmonella enterica subsp. enterica serovar Infantis]
RGHRHQFTGKLTHPLRTLTDDAMTVLVRIRDQLLGKIQERYGFQNDQAANEVVDWETRTNYRW